MRIAIMATSESRCPTVNLGKADHQIAAIARGPHLDAGRGGELVLDGPEGKQRLSPRIATDDPARVGLTACACRSNRATQRQTLGRAALYVSLVPDRYVANVRAIA